MPKMTHTDMNRGKGTTGSTAQAPKVYVVDDASEPSLDDKIAEFEGSGPITIDPPAPPVKTDTELQKILEDLIFIGGFSKVIELADHKFEIKTISHSENNEIVRELMKFGDTADLFTIRTLTLAHALKSIDGRSLDMIDLPGEFKSDFHKRTALINNMQLSLVERLHKAYEDMLKETNSTVYNEKIKNS